jgi:hypothetical protein
MRPTPSPQRRISAIVDRCDGLTFATAFHNLRTPDDLRKALVGMPEGFRIRPLGLNEWIVY